MPKGSANASSLSREAEMGESLSAAKLEMRGLVFSLSETLETLNGKVEPLLEFFDNDMSYEEGDEILDYLRVKKQLLLSYVTNLVFYIQLKVEGKSCASHPVMDTLLEQRYAMEKMRQMDGKLKYQIDRLVKAADIGQQDKGSSLRPNPLALLAKEDGRAIVDQIATGRGNGNDDGGESQGSDDDARGDNYDETNNGGDEIYRPPRMEAAYYMDAETKAEKQEAALKRKRKKLKNSEIFDALREEFTVAPEMSSSTGISSQSGLEKKLREDANERTDFEEDRFVRMTVTRKEKQAIKRKEREISQTNILGGYGNVDDLDDLVDSFKEVSESSTNNKKPKNSGSVGMNGRGNFAFDDDEDVNMGRGKGKGKKNIISTTSAAGSEDAIKRAAMAFSQSSTLSSGERSKTKKEKKKTKK